MKQKVWQDEYEGIVRTNVDWELQDVTARMVNWFWCNMDKFDILWHPNQHYGCWWVKGFGPSDLGTMINTIHNAPQKWNDGKMLNLYIRMEALDNVPAAAKELIKYDHVLIAGGDTTGKLSEENPTAPTTTWRIHQWQATDDGIIGMSSAVTLGGEDSVESGLIWAAHGSEEISNWERSLPEFYRLYKIVENREICPYYDFKVNGKGLDAEYVYM